MRRLHLGDLVAATLVLIGAIAIVRGAMGADWQLMRKLPGQDWQQRGPILDQQTACLTALASDGFVVPSGTLLRCERVLPTKEAKQ